MIIGPPLKFHDGRDNLQLSHTQALEGHLRRNHLVGADSNDPSPASERDRRQCGVDVELVQNALDVRADGAQRDVQHF